MLSPEQERDLETLKRVTDTLVEQNQFLLKIVEEQGRRIQELEATTCVQ